MATQDLALFALEAILEGFLLGQQDLVDKLLSFFKFDLGLLKQIGEILYVFSKLLVTRFLATLVAFLTA